MEYSNINLLATRSAPPGLDDEVSSKTNNIENINQKITPPNIDGKNIENKNQNANNKPTHINISEILLASYNVRTIAEQGRFNELCQMADKYKLDFIALQEIRCTTDNEFDYWKSANTPYTLIYTSANKQMRNRNGGIGLLINNKFSNSIKKYVKISDRALAVHFETKPELVMISVYAPTESSKNDVKIKFYDELEEYQNKIKFSVTIILGDLNAQLGKESHITHPNIIGNFAYHEKTNGNGKKLIDFCEQNSFRPIQTRFNHKLNFLYTWNSLTLKDNNGNNGDHLNKTQIDHILISSRWLNCIKDCKAYKGWIDSDHRILVAKFKLTTKITTIKAEQKPTPDWEQIPKNINIQLELQKNIKQLIKKDDKASIQTKFNNLNRTLKEASKIIPEKKNLKTPWVSKESDKLRDERNKALLEYEKDRTIENRKKVTNLRNRLKRSYKRDKEKFYDDICEEIKKAENINDTTNLYKKIRFLTGDYKKKPLQLKNKNGETVASTQAILNIWKNYFFNLLNVINENNLPNLNIPPDLPIRTDAFDMYELTKVIRTLKNAKAPGIDGIRNELIKYGGKEIKQEVLDICNEIFRTKIAPWQMTTNKIIPIYKKGDAQDPNNYRGISLLSTITKIYNKLLLNRIYNHVNPLLEQNQRGFRRNSSTVQAINTLRRILEGYYKKKLPIVATFIDYAKAFDSINREVMWQILRHYGIPNKIVEAIKVMYINSTARVTYNGELSSEFKINSGILQGDALSPFLFITVLDFAMKRVPKTFGLETHINPSRYIQDIEYADDTVITNNSPQQALEHLKHLEENVKLIGLIINKNKSYYMSNIQSIEELQPLSDKITKVNKCKYLGSYIDCSKTDILHRRNLAQVMFWKMKKTWNAKDLSLNLKLKIFDVMCVSIFLYGAETWIINNETENKINSFATTCYRKILKISKFDRITNEEIYRRTNREPLLTRVKKRQIDFIQKTAGLEDTNLIKTYLVYSPKHGIKTKGRLPKLYSDYASTLLGDQAHILQELLVNR